MNIKYLIERSGKTQTEIARALGVHQTLVSLWARGKCNPTITIITRLASVLGCTADEIISCFEK
jgi:transcriptional regulator with XRE-family HTH domain